MKWWSSFSPDDFFYGYIYSYLVIFDTNNYYLSFIFTVRNIITLLIISIVKLFTIYKILNYISDDMIILLWERIISSYD